MPVENYPIITSTLTERRLSQFREFLPELEAARNSGEIPNTRYTKAKEAISRILEAAWVEVIRKPFAWNRDYIQAAGEAERDALDALGSPPQTNTLKKAVRISNGMPDTEAGREVRRFMGEVSPVLELLIEAKTLAVKRTVAAPAPSSTETYSTPEASGTAVAQVLSELTDITRDAKNSIRDAIYARHEGMANAFLKAQAEAVTEAPRKRFDVYSYVLQRSRAAGQNRADPYLRSKLEKVLTSRFDAETGRDVFSLKPDAPGIMQEIAQSEADAICAQYIERNLAKLAPIIEARGDYRDMKVLGRSVNPGQMEGRLELRFAGEARFEARSQAVFSFSHLGTPFMRYPLTFHDVILSNGDRMPNPSEKRMNEIFATEGTSPAPN